MFRFREGWQSFKAGLNKGQFGAYLIEFWNHAWEIWWGAGVIGLACTLLTLYYAPSRWILGWAVAWVFLIAGYYAWRPYYIRLTARAEITGVRLQSSPQSRTMISGITGLPMSDEILAYRTFIQAEFKCLTEAPLYECKGYLKQLRRLVGDRWESADFGSLVLKWDNENEVQEITQHPHVEKSLNVLSIRESDRRVEICCFADLSHARVVQFFSEGIKKYEFDITITYSDRVNGHLVSVAPASACLSVEFTSDPSKPLCLLVENVGTCASPLQPTIG